MKREFLKGLGLEDSVIDSIMKENGADINKAKSDLDKTKEELETTKTQLEEANTTISSYKDMDIEGIKSSVDEWKNKSEELENKIKEKDYEYSAKAFLSNYKFSSKLAEKAAIEDFKAKGFKLEDGKFLGAEDYMNQLKEENPTAFISEEGNDPLPNIVKPTNSNPANAGRVYTQAELEKMSPQEINNNWSDVQASLAKI